jgi:hypothetical protein
VRLAKLVCPLATLLIYDVHMRTTTAWTSSAILSTASMRTSSAWRALTDEMDECRGPGMIERTMTTFGGVAALGGIAGDGPSTSCGGALRAVSGLGVASSAPSLCPLPVGETGALRPPRLKARGHNGGTASTQET